jgi:hypothetical protein
MGKRERERGGVGGEGGGGESEGGEREGRVKEGRQAATGQARSREIVVAYLAIHLGELCDSSLTLRSSAAQHAHSAATTTAGDLGPIECRPMLAVGTAAPANACRLNLGDKTH